MGAILVKTIMTVIIHAIVYNTCLNVCAIQKKIPCDSYMYMRF